MALPNISLNKRTSVISISTFMVLSIGLIFTNAGAITDSTELIYQHKSDVMPHPSIAKEIEYFEKSLSNYIEEDKNALNKVHDKLDKLLIITCSNPNNKCT